MQALTSFRAAAIQCNATPNPVAIPAAWTRTGREASLLIQNVSAVTVEVGGSDLVAGQGYQIFAGQTFTIDAQFGTLYIVSLSGTANLRIFEAG
jgi:hypothetical protein